MLELDESTLKYNSREKHITNDDKNVDLEDKESVNLKKAIQFKEWEIKVIRDNKNNNSTICDTSSTFIKDILRSAKFKVFLFSVIMTLNIIITINTFIDIYDYNMNCKLVGDPIPKYPDQYCGYSDDHFSEDYLKINVNPCDSKGNPYIAASFTVGAYVLIVSIKIYMLREYNLADDLNKLLSFGIFFLSLLSSASMYNSRIKNDGEYCLRKQTSITLAIILPFLLSGLNVPNPIIIIISLSASIGVASYLIVMNVKRELFDSLGYIKPLFEIIDIIVVFLNY